MRLRIGLVSDTHGLLRPEALAFLAGADHIVHAGDIVGAAILPALAKLAPVTAVRGNNDRGEWADRLRDVERIELAGVAICVVHDIADYRAVAGDRVVVTGHSHAPRVREEAGVLYVNPGSAGPRRFRLPISAGELIVEDGRVVARLATLGA
ncbi:MAG TPA: metallophosphoesterase family protein [Xanthomonadales bacterium]|nr:metallophosphoesterase family protein [Xanthomonadales bacterium]